MMQSQLADTHCMNRTLCGPSGTHAELHHGCRRDEINSIYQTPLLDLVFRAAKVHRMHHDPSMVQKCTLLSIKTGGCPEDCNYCSQSSKHSKETGTKATKLMDLEEVYEAAVRAKASGSTRFCMGAAWRGPSQVRQAVKSAAASRARELTAL